MKLVIDIGNTQAKVAVYDNNILQYASRRPRLSIEWLKWVIDTYSTPQTPLQTIMSSVAEPYQAIVSWLEQMGELVIFTSSTPVPLVNCYQTPETLGSDRLAAATAAYHYADQSHVLVIQAGSCLTHDFITSSGSYMGGGISPGMEMRFMALHTFTERLPLITYRPFANLTGQTTEESILSGVINGMVAEIDGLIALYREKYNPLKVVMTGGDLNYFDKRLKNSIFAHPNLVLEGLNIILGFNEFLPKVTTDRRHTAD